MFYLVKWDGGAFSRGVWHWCSCVFPGSENYRSYGGLSKPAASEAAHTTPLWGSVSQISAFTDHEPAGHMTASKILQCEFCSATFASNSELIGHTNSVHLNRHQFVCILCGKGFCQNEHFSDHMNMHNNIKPHQCAQCSAYFTYKTNLRRHVRSGVCKKQRNSS